MGVLTPLAVRLGAQPWLPRLLRPITACDKGLQRITCGRLGLLDVAGLPNVLLTVRGRKSGQLRSTPLLCVREGGQAAPRWLLAGSSFGAPAAPAWVHNLREAPTAEISKGRWRTTVVPEELESQERVRAWKELCRTWPNFDVYQRRTERIIPVFRLVPVDER
ncbi:nitroreductase/quinone reductase family protein [Nocardiopsis coralliicola]